MHSLANLARLSLDRQEADLEVGDGTTGEEGSEDLGPLPPAPAGPAVRCDSDSCHFGSCVAWSWAGRMAISSPCQGHAVRHCSHKHQRLQAHLKGVLVAPFPQPLRVWAGVVATRAP